MNIHVKIWDNAENNRKIEEIASLLEAYDCTRHVYFMSSNTEALLEMRERLPFAAYCQGARGGNDVMIEKAIKYGFDKVQIVSWHPYHQEMIDRCHANGIRVNFCQANNAPLAKELLEMGVDCILTDKYYRVHSDLENLIP